MSDITTFDSLLHTNSPAFMPIHEQHGQTDFRQQHITHGTFDSLLHGASVPITSEVIQNSTAAERSKLHSFARYAGSFLVGATLGTVIVVPGASMIAQGELNPITASIDYVKATSAMLGIADWCPPAPNEESIHKLTAESIRKREKSYLISAKEHGVELTKLPLPNEAIDQAKTPAEATTIISEYSKSLFGFGVDIDMPGKTIDMDAYKAALKAMAKNESLMPIGLVKEANVSSITITNLFEQTVANKIGTSGNFQGFNNKVTIDINHLSRPSVFAHEILGHGIQKTSCGIIGYNDEAMTAPNPPGAIYTNQMSSYFSNPSIPNVFATNYAQTNEGEDYAETVASYVTGGDFSLKQISNTTPLGRKYVVVASRFNSIVPGSADYLHDIQPEMAKLETSANKMPLVYQFPQR